MLCHLAKLLEIPLYTFARCSCPQHDIFEHQSALRVWREPGLHLSWILSRPEGVLIRPYYIVKRWNLALSQFALPILRHRVFVVAKGFFLPAPKTSFSLFALVFLELLFCFEQSNWNIPMVLVHVVRRIVDILEEFVDVDELRAISGLVNLTEHFGSVWRDDLGELKVVL